MAFRFRSALIAVSVFAVAALPAVYVAGTTLSLGAIGLLVLGAPLALSTSGRTWHDLRSASGPILLYLFSSMLLVIAGLWTLAPLRSQLGSAVYFAACMLAVLVGHRWGSNEVLARRLNTVLFGILLASVYLALVQIGWSFLPSYRVLASWDFDRKVAADVLVFGRATGHMLNPNDFAWFSLICGFACARDARPWLRFCAIGLAATGLLLSGSRGIGLAAAIALAWLTWEAARSRGVVRRSTLVGPMLGVVGMAAVIAASRSAHRVGDIAERFRLGPADFATDGSVTGRTDQLSIAWSTATRWPFGRLATAQSISAESLDSEFLRAMLLGGVPLLALLAVSFILLFQRRPGPLNAQIIRRAFLVALAVASTSQLPIQGSAGLLGLVVLGRLASASSPRRQALLRGAGAPRGYRTEATGSSQ